MYVRCVCFMATQQRCYAHRFRIIHTYNILPRRRISSLCDVCTFMRVDEILRVRLRP